MTDTILHSFAYSLDYLREQVADLSDAQMVQQPAGVVNHPAWIIGHLTFACQMLGGVVGLSAWLPEEWAKQFGPGSAPVAQASVYVRKESLLARLSNAQQRIERAVQSFDPARLDDPFPDPSYRDVFPSIRHALTQVLVGHTAFHVGQISVWRKAMGLPRMSRSFE